MDHQNDNEIDGLEEAIQRLPVAYRSSAYSAVLRSLMEDGYAEIFGPFSISYRDPAGNGHKRAKLIIFLAESFAFDLFYVPVEGRKYAPAVGRVYHLVNGSESAHVN